MTVDNDFLDLELDDKQRLQQNDAIDNALHTADAAEKFSFTAFLSTSLLALFGIGSMTIPFFALPFLILSRLFSGIMTGLVDSHQKNFNLSSLLNMSVGIVLGVLPMLVIVISMSVLEHAALIAQLMTLGSIFFGISSVFHFGGLFANLFKAVMAPAGSNERKAYLQQAIKHTINCFISVALFALITFSFAPPVTLALMGTVSIVSTFYMAWSFSPNLRRGIKWLFGLKQSDETLEFIHSHKSSQEHIDKKTVEDIHVEKSHFGHFFKRAYRREVIRHYLSNTQPELAKNYLLDQIKEFREKYTKQFPNLTENEFPKKQQEKLAALEEAEGLLTARVQPSEKAEDRVASHEAIKGILKRHPLSEQSFFADVSDTKDILEAVDFYLHHRESVASVPMAAP